MIKGKIIKSFSSLGKHLQNTYKFTHIIEQASINNPWFNTNFIRNALNNICYMLNEDALSRWAQKYNFNNTNNQKKVGLLLPGNIPAVGIHDILCTLASNNIANIKLSSVDNVLIPYILNILTDIDCDFKKRIYYVNKFTHIDALIATGRTETVNYFNEYFKNIPKIIRKHMTSVAVLTGNESGQELSSIADDIFLYYGLGCRNVTKLYVPTDYFKDNIEALREALKKYMDLCITNTKFMNNYTYNKALYLLNKISFIDNDFFTITENKTLTSRLANLNYEIYENIPKLEQNLRQSEDYIQCIATGTNLASCSISKQVPFGGCQRPDINSYADGIDTMEFLLNIDNVQTKNNHDNQNFL